MLETSSRFQGATHKKIYHEFIWNFCTLLHAIQLKKKLSTEEVCFSQNAINVLKDIDPILEHKVVHQSPYIEYWTIQFCLHRSYGVQEIVR